MAEELVLLCHVEFSPLAELELFAMAPLLAQAVEDALLSDKEAMEIATETILRGIKITLC